MGRTQMPCADGSILGLLCVCDGATGGTLVLIFIKLPHD